MLVPRSKVPDLALETVSHGSFDLAAACSGSEQGVVVCFYRGLHCPLCANYLMELEKLADDFAAKGVDCVAVSSDGQDRAQQMAEKISASKLPVAYGLELSKAREWGLYISKSIGTTSIGIEEPELFSEPGLFLISPEQALYYGAVQTMPFVRPHFRELLGALDFAIEKKYPARGEYTGEV